MFSYIPQLFIAYGALLFIGGMIGYVHTGSPGSLFAGVVGSILCALAGYGMLRKWVLGQAGALLLSGFFTLFFAYRYFVTGKVMPGLIFALLSAAMFLALLFYNRGKRL